MFTKKDQIFRRAPSPTGEGPCTMSRTTIRSRTCSGNAMFPDIARYAAHPQERRIVPEGIENGSPFSISKNTHEVGRQFTHARKARYSCRLHDEEFMLLALSLAAKARTSPNPKVGAVIVKDGRVIGMGHHQKAGLPHAEIEAIQNARLKTQNPYVTRGAVLYITLEPCVHSNKDKKTPPCVPAIINAGIKKVVCAMRDPNPLVNGKGIAALEKADIEIVIGVCEQEARRFNEAYAKRVTAGVPFVTMKVAMSLDGKIATKTGDSKWISGEASRRLARTMRDSHDGVMVGIGTVLKDNPRLTCRFKSSHDPVRIIIDSKLRIPTTANVLKRPNGMVIIGCGKNHDKNKKAVLEHIGARVFVASRPDGEVDLRKFMKMIADSGINSILLEGGSALDGAMIDAGLVDRFCFFIAPKIIGGKDAKPPIDGNGIDSIKNALNLKNVKIEQVGVDLLVIGDVQPIHST